MQGSTGDGYRIRTMTAREVAIAVDWAAGEGWNPGLHDATCFRAADPGGFLVGELDGLPIATISVVRYGPRFGFLGLYIVRSSHRGRGYGRQLWNAGLAHLRGCTVGLDGVVAQQANYRKSGFDLAYRNIRYRGVGGRPAGNDAHVVSLASIPFEALNDYDKTLFPADRSAFLRAWIDQPQSMGYAVLERDRVAGYGMIRAARVGYKIGPLFADDAARASALFDALTASVPSGEAVFLDVPELNRDAVVLAQRHAMDIVFETARMYAGVAPDLPMERIFGVTTFELG
jgi:GNAT superfamily N-acetyltransferase